MATGPGLEPIVRGEGEQRRMETGGLALAFEHGALRVVVEDDPSEPAYGQ